MECMLGLALDGMGGSFFLPLGLGVGLEGVCCEMAAQAHDQVASERKRARDQGFGGLGEYQPGNKNNSKDWRNIIIGRTNPGCSIEIKVNAMLWTKSKITSVRFLFLKCITFSSEIWLRKSPNIFLRYDIKCWLLILDTSTIWSIQTVKLSGVFKALCLKISPKMRCGLSPNLNWLIVSYSRIHDSWSGRVFATLLSYCRLGPASLFYA